MSDLLSLTKVNGVDATIAKVELIYDGNSYKVLCTCRVNVLGTIVDNVTVHVPVNKDLKLHVDMFNAAVLKQLKEGADGS